MSDDHEWEAAAEAFTGLRASVERQGEEIVLQRRAIAGMAVMRADVPELPNCSETLGGITQGIGILMQEGAKLGKRPALDMTPKQMVARIIAVGASARSDDRALIAEARRALGDTSRTLHNHIKEARGVAAQKRVLIQAGLGGLADGALLWSALPGFVVRNLAPTSWHWSERMATCTLSADDMWNGARRLGAVASSADWDTMVEDAIIVQDNRDVMDGCRKAMGKNAKSTKCTNTLSRLDAPAAGDRQDQALKEKTR